MGLSRCLYIGPYAVVEDKEHLVKVSVRACSSATCPAAKPKHTYDAVKSAFCPACGAKVGLMEIVVGTRLDYYEVMGETERLTRAGEDDNDTIYLIVNEGDAYEKRDFHYDYGTNEDLSSLSPEEIIWFEQRYQPELKALKDAYGDVQIRWGVHYYQW